MDVVNTEEEVNYIVSGLPRSGTSMVMQTLEAGGMPIATDEEREPDESNPKGYLEIEGVIDKLSEDGEFVFRFKGKVVKIIAYGLRYLPPGDYKIIYMERNIEEVLDSMEKMAGITDEERRETRLSFDKLNGMVKAELEGRSDVEVLFVSYNDTLEDPDGQILRVFDFLGLPLDPNKMIDAVDRRLYRQRRS